jgi:mono/diheme cytochrome c family protein
MGGCNDCHTHASYAEDGSPFMGSRDEFIQTMRTRVDHDKKHPQISPLLQVMPWPSYQIMSDYDFKAVYEYLRAIPSLPDNPNPGAN